MPLVTHFSMWAILKSPLIMGHDLLHMVSFVCLLYGMQLLFVFQSNETWTILTNTAIIGINQDPDGQPGIRLWKRKLPEDGDLQLWRGDLANR